MRMSLALIALLSVLLFLGGGCGGSGGGPAPVTPPGPVTVDIPVDVTQSGFITSGGNVAASVPPGAGDLADNSELRGFFTFPIGTIPPTATLQTAVLRVYQTGTIATPYTDFTALSVDSLDLGGVLDLADFGAAALSTAGTLAPFDATIGVKTLSVLTQVAADRTAARPVSSFRLNFLGAPGADNAGDRANFGVSSPGTETVLRVTYQP